MVEPAFVFTPMLRMDLELSLSFSNFKRKKNSGLQNIRTLSYQTNLVNLSIIFKFNLIFRLNIFHFDILVKYINLSILSQTFLQKPFCNRSGEKGWHAREVQSRCGIMQFNINHLFLTILWLDIKPPPQRLSIQESCHYIISFQDYL